MFKQRALTTLVGLPVIIAIIWFGEPWFTLAAAIWGAGAVYEFYKITGKAKVLPLTFFGILWTLLFIVRPHFPDILHIDMLLTTAVILPLVWLLGTRKKEDAFARWSWTIAGIFYIGWLMSYMVMLRGIDDGRSWAYLALLATFASDIFAYLAGRAIGRHKLAPAISPGKTWEGSIAGVVGAVLASLLVVAVLNAPVGYGQAVLLGIIISIAGQLGDLVKSLFKRNMGVKDSGNILPGHGGFLDRLDSLLFAGVAVYYCAYILTI